MTCNQKKYFSILSVWLKKEEWVHYPDSSHQNSKKLDYFQNVWKLFFLSISDSSGTQTALRIISGIFWFDIN